MAVGLKPQGICTQHEPAAPTSRGRCRECVNAQARARYDPEKSREYQYRSKFGVDIAWYERQLARQGGGCAICGHLDPRAPGGRFVIDHDHSCCPGVRTCGRCIRSLLCGPCNSAIGLMQESVETLRRAIDYLEAPHALK